MSEATFQFLPGTGRGTMRSMVEGAPRSGVLASGSLRSHPSTTDLRPAVPLPGTGRNFA